MNDNTTSGQAWDESEDIEELLAEARRSYNPSPQERWKLAVDLAREVLRLLPGGRVSCGDHRRIPGPVDYITASPNAPLTVFAGDGRFVVSFLADGTWIEANGKISSTAGMILLS